MLGHFGKLLKPLDVARDLWREEMGSPNRLRHAFLWRHGFVSDRYELYGLQHNDPRQYVSDVQRIVQGRRINHPATIPICSNKYLFHKVMQSRFAASLPSLWGVVIRGRIHWEQSAGPSSDSDCVLDEMLDGQLGLVAKPIKGGGGKGLHVLRRTPAGLEHNGRATTAERVRLLLHGLDGYLLEEHLQQDAYAQAIFPDSTNTLRVPMMRDGTRDEAFIPIAVHRFGNVQSVPTDNFSQGGVSCEVDLETGVLGPGGALDDAGKLIWHDSHPATGAQIKGVVVPHWQATKDLLAAVSDALPFLSYVGWDIVVTADGPKLIEGNHYMNPRVLQIHRPLLADARVRAFYAQLGGRSQTGAHRARRSAPTN